MAFRRAKFKRADFQLLVNYRRTDSMQLPNHEHTSALDIKPDAKLWFPQ